TFETIKLFLNIPACTFVIGADARKIEQAITGVYRVGEQTALSFAEDYLEKIIQIPFRIPEQQLTDIECYVAMLVLYRHLQEGGWQLLLGERQKLIAQQGLAEHFNQWVVQNESHCPGKKEALKELADTLPYVRILAHGLRGNPRQIKRFLNILGLRQRLAKLNNLPVTQDVLVKLLVIEYAWRGFFENLVETYDPASETSPLLAEIAKAKPDKKSDSAMVAAATELPGLFEFLKQEPSLDGVLLAPYLFLAQTALTTQRGAGLASFDETARTLVERIASDDRIRSSPAAKRAVREEKAVVDAIVRALIPRLIAADEEKLRVNLLTGLDTICQVHTEHYAQFLKTLDQLSITEKGASALVASTIVSNAEKAAQVIPEGLKSKYKGGLAAAAKVVAQRPRGGGHK
ncbi:MAG: P-loop NTPase fold protein, partial [Pirellulaceae bacterium]